MGFNRIKKKSHYRQYGFAVVSCSIVKGQRKRMIFDHRIWKEFGVEVGEGNMSNMLSERNVDAWQGR